MTDHAGPSPRYECNSVFQIVTCEIVTGYLVNLVHNPMKICVTR